MDLHLWLAFVAAASVILALPGPTILLVVSYALSQGRRVALATALGVAAGDFLALSASLLGLGALLSASAGLFTLLKWIGAAYLVWLGLKLWRAAPQAKAGSLTEGAAVPPRHIFLHALTVTALNPKSIGFFIAFVPQFLRPSDPLAPQFAVLIATFVGLATLNVLAWALMADRLRARIRRPGVLAAMHRAGGAALMAMGALTLTLKRTG